MNLRKWIDKVAGIPPKSVWLWSDRQSFLTKIIVYVFVSLRLLSPLQWFKLGHRKWFNYGVTGDHDQKRVNFHAQHTELYFIFFLCVFLALRLLIPSNVNALVKPVIFILTLETFTWIAYYLFWRNYAEPRFTLYSPAEYLVLFPIVITIQIIGLSFLLGMPTPDILKSYFIGSDDAVWQLQILGTFYVVIVIANLRSMTPATNFKNSNTINIIGCGDVVLNRLIPGILNSDLNIEHQHLTVYSIDPSDQERLRAFPEYRKIAFNCPSGSIEEKQSKIVKECISHASPVIIATPSDSHYYYLTKLIAANLPVICEKPLVRFKPEITHIIKNAQDYRGNLFALSYYTLEKALPLTYFLQLNTTHKPLLEFKYQFRDAIDTDNTLILEIQENLGKLTGIELYLLEGVERSPDGNNRKWTERQNEHAYETMLHLVLLAHKILGHYEFDIQTMDFDCVRGCREKQSDEKPTTYLQLDNDEQSKTNKHIPLIKLAAGKYVPPHLTQRGGILRFEDGYIELNFDLKTLKAYIGPNCVLEIKNKYIGNYMTLSMLMNFFLQSGYEGVRFDEFEDQIEVLKWMSSYDFNPDTFFTYDEKSEKIPGL